MSLKGKNILITGATRRLGRSMAIAVARTGAHVFLHHGHSPKEARATLADIEAFGGKATIIQAELDSPEETSQLIKQVASESFLYALVNNAAIFEPKDFTETDLATWNRHLNINLTAPFLLCKEFAKQILDEHAGRIVNILDWRALRPGPDHLAYTISKAALAALTRSLATALAPNITVNGLALGAILQPSKGEIPIDLLSTVPAKRWADVNEVCQALLFLLDGPAYITGEIIHVDGGRHLV